MGLLKTQYLAIMLTLGLVTLSQLVKAEVRYECVQPIDTSFDGMLLTSQEKIEILKQRLLEDMVRFEECMKHGTGSGGAGGAGAQSGAQGAGDNQGEMEASAVAGVKGTESGEGEQNGTGTSGGAVSGQATAVAGIEGTEARTPTKLTTVQPPQDEQDINNGAQPKDLKIIDNDAVLLEQIRLAAENETDPELKKQLMEEYRKRSEVRSNRRVDLRGAN